MSYDSSKSQLLCRQTLHAGSSATLAEVMRANQLQSADDEVTRLRRGLEGIARGGNTVEARMAAQLLSPAMVTAEMPPDRPHKAAP